MARVLEQEVTKGKMAFEEGLKKLHMDKFSLECHFD